jgi:threonine dehydratase
MDPTGDYLTRILNSKVYELAVETDLDPAPNLSERLGNRILLKREDTQPVFSFKIRGAYNKMANLAPDVAARGVICASAGNHAQGVALSARHLGVNAVVVMPTTTPEIKVASVQALGADIVLFGESYSEAYEHSLELAERRLLTFVHPYDDADVIAGQGTVGMEILRQHARPIHAIFCCVGGGGLISGIAAYVKAVRPEIRVIGVEADDAASMTRALELGRPVTLDHVGLFADGAAVRRVGDETFRVAAALVDEMITVDNDAICAAIKDVFEDTRTILEPAGALAVAGAKEYVARTGVVDETLVAVASGANMNFDRLRFVAERAELGEEREAVLAVTIPERPGSFKAFIGVLGNRNITEFNYRMADRDEAHIFVGVSVRSRSEVDELVKVLDHAELPAIDLTDNEMAKTHVRYMVGGHAPEATDEVLYRFIFPERPGALMKFLTNLRSDWNISLFHYRNHGADFGRVLVGMQVPSETRPHFAAFLERLGYEYIEETNNPAYRTFLG